MGFGKHNADIDEKAFSQLLLTSNAAGFATILAACWSKTSFAMTLLRITQGWTKGFVWFVIITVNLTLAMTATIQWAQCSPIEKIWISEMEGTCLPRKLIINLNTFAAGKTILRHDGGEADADEPQPTRAPWMSPSHSCRGRSSGTCPSIRKRKSARSSP